MNSISLVCLNSAPLSVKIIGNNFRKVSKPSAAVNQSNCSTTVSALPSRIRKISIRFCSTKIRVSIRFPVPGSPSLCPFHIGCLGVLCHVGEEVFVSPVLSVLLVQESFCWRLLLLSGTIPDLAAKIQISNTQSPGIDVVVQCSLAYRKLCSMLRIDVSQGLPFLMSGVTRASRAAIASFCICGLFLASAYLRLCHSICLLCGVVYSVGLAFFCVCCKHCRRRAVSATPCKDRHCMPYILSGSPLLCRCSTFGGNFPSHTNRLVCILWRFGSVFLMDVHRESLWRSVAILPTHIVGFCGFARLFHSGFFSHISLLRFLFDPTMSFDSCFPAFCRM